MRSTRSGAFDGSWTLSKFVPVPSMVMFRNAFANPTKLDVRYQLFRLHLHTITGRDHLHISYIKYLSTVNRFAHPFLLLAIRCMYCVSYEHPGFLTSRERPAMLALNLNLAI